MNNNTPNTGRSDQNTEAEKQNIKAAANAPNNPPKGATGKGKGKGRKPQKPKKSHKKKGTANDAPPASIGMTQPGFGALLAIEAANPEMSRKQIIENALRLYAGHISYLPPIQLARLDSDTLITMSGVAAKLEKSCKKIMRYIILSELDDEEKAKHVAPLKKLIEHLRDERLIMCRMTGIPISHNRFIDLDFIISNLEILRDQETDTVNSIQDAYNNAIQILTAYKPC